MYMSVNAVEQLRLYKILILLLIMKYFVLNLVSYSHATLLKMSLPIAPQKENPPQDTLAYFVTSSKG